MCSSNDHLDQPRHKPRHALRELPWLLVALHSSSRSPGCSSGAPCSTIRRSTSTRHLKSRAAATTSTTHVPAAPRAASAVPACPSPRDILPTRTGSCIIPTKPTRLCPRRLPQAPPPRTHTPTATPPAPRAARSHRSKPWHSEAHTALLVQVPHKGQVSPPGPPPPAEWPRLTAQQCPRTAKTSLLAEVMP